MAQCGFITHHKKLFFGVIYACIHLHCMTGILISLVHSLILLNLCFYIHCVSIYYMIIEAVVKNYY